MSVAGAAPEAARPGTLHRIVREWTRGTEVRIVFPMRGRVTTRYNEAIAIERGPLVYSLRIGEEWTRVNADKPHRELPHGDFEVRPTTAWSYGLLVDESRVERDVTFEERPVGAQPFSPDGAGMAAKVRGRALPRWKLAHGWAGEVSPADAVWADPSRATTDAPVEDLTLIPYGCTNIRITEFPKAGK